MRAANPYYSDASAIAAVFYGPVKLMVSFRLKNASA